MYSRVQGVHSISRPSLARPARALAAIALTALFISTTGAVADAQTIGYLYSALGGGVAELAVQSDTSLTSLGTVAGGPSTIEYPGSVAIAKVADGENLYQLSGTGKTETIYQYSVDPSTGKLTADSPASVGSIPILASEERREIAVFNPAASGQPGQNAIYVLSGTDSEHAALYMFDIDPTT